MRLTGSKNRHDSSPMQTTRYSEDTIAEMNREHDAKYGFTMDCQTIYQNVRRLPESVFVPASKCWEERK